MCKVQVIALLGSGPHMPITAAAAWALFSATQSNAATRDAAFAAGALEPLLLLVEGSGAQVCLAPPALFRLSQGWQTQSQITIWHTHSMSAATPWGL